GIAADVYGLGTVLYETLTGLPPFKGATRTVTLHWVCTKPPTPPARIKRGISPVLQAICLRCLEKNPADRFASAQELADDLGCWLRGEPTKTRPPGLVARTLQWTKRRSRVTLGLMAASLLIVAFGLIIGWYAFQKQAEFQRTVEQRRLDDAWTA